VPEELSVVVNDPELVAVDVSDLLALNVSLAVADLVHEIDAEAVADHVLLADFVTDIVCESVLDSVRENVHVFVEVRDALAEFEPESVAELVPLKVAVAE
jgi:hypothetical protein